LVKEKNFLTGKKTELLGGRERMIGSFEGEDQLKLQKNKKGIWPEKKKFVSLWERKISSHGPKNCILKEKKTVYIGGERKGISHFFLSKEGGFFSPKPRHLEDFRKKRTSGQTFLQLKGGATTARVGRVP